MCVCNRYSTSKIIVARPDFDTYKEKSIRPAWLRNIAILVSNANVCVSRCIGPQLAVHKGMEHEC